MENEFVFMCGITSALYHDKEDAKCDSINEARHLILTALQNDCEHLEYMRLHSQYINAIKGKTIKTFKIIKNG